MGVLTKEAALLPSCGPVQRMAPARDAKGMQPPGFDFLANRFQWAVVSTRMRRLLFGVCNPW